MNQECKCDSCEECSCDPEVCRCDCHQPKADPNEVFKTQQDFE